MVMVFGSCLVLETSPIAIAARNGRAGLERVVLMFIYDITKSVVRRRNTYTKTSSTSTFPVPSFDLRIS